MKGSYHTDTSLGRETFADDLPIIRHEAAVSIPIRVDTRRPCGTCGKLTDNRPSLAKDGKSEVLCEACCTKLIVEPLRAKAAKVARCKREEKAHG